MSTTPSSKEAATRAINVRVPLKIYEQLESLAKATAKTKSFVTVEALASYLDAQSWQIQEIEAGITDADRGEFATDDEVNAMFAKHGA